MEAGYGPGIAAAAHALRSGASTIRADQLTELLTVIEQAGRDGTLDNTMELLGQIHLELDAVVAYLDGMVGGRSVGAEATGEVGGETP